MSDPNLITTYNFQGQPFLVKMNIINGYLDLIITDKQSGEEWECSYDASYIESVTRKTGNFKQFEIFATMLKAGLLKTSDSIMLDLLTFEDLESMRIRRLRNHSTNHLSTNTNRRYLILTYSVEFDKINYPLPLEYCGPPDPVILQATIRRLEAELNRANDQLNSIGGEKHQVQLLQKRIEKLTTENLQLHEEVGHLTRLIENNNRKPKTQVQMLQKAIMQLERNVKSERNSHHKLVEKLQNDKIQLMNQLEKLKASEKALRVQLQQRIPFQNPTRTNHKVRHPYISKSHEIANVNMIYQRKKSPLVKTDHEAKRNQRSRSASPQLIIHDDSWKHHSKNRWNRSRSSSVSSRKNCLNIDIPSSSRSSSRQSLRHSRKPSPCSCNNSLESFSNSSQVHADIFKKRNTSPAYSRSTSSNVKKLETRVRKLFQNQHTEGS